MALVRRLYDERLTPMSLTPEDLLASRLRSLTNHEAEQALLGGLFANNSWLDRVDQIIEPQHFAVPLHGRVFEEVRKRVRRGETANCLTLRQQFDRDPAFPNGGGWNYLVKLENSVISIIALPDYAITIRDLWRRRELLMIAESASVIAASAEGTAELAWARLRDDGIDVWQSDLNDQSLAEILIKQRPAMEWLVEDMIPMAEVTLFTGDSGTGKSYLAQQLMMAVASGTPWLGMAVRKGSAYGLFCEDPEKIIHLRALAIVQRFGLEAADFSQMRVADRATEETELFGAALDGNPLNPNWTPLWRRFCTRMRKLRPTVCVIDTVADVFGGDENKRAQVRRFIRGLKHLAQELGTAFVVAAHPSIEGMRSGSGYSGSTAWRGTVRSHLYFRLPDEDDRPERDKDQRLLTARKANYSGLAEDLRLHWDRGAFVRIDDDDAGTVASIRRRELCNHMIAMVADGEARGSLYSASPRAESRYIVNMLVIAHPEHSRNAAKHMLGDLLAQTVLLESKLKGDRRAGLILNPNRKPDKS